MSNDGDQNIPFETYKLAVEMADKVSGRRDTANTFFLTLNSGLLLLHDKVNTVFLALIGLVFCVSWWMLLKSYRELNSAKFQVIQEMEVSLPLKPFTDEWSKLKQDPVKSWRKRYAELGQVERIVPFLFSLFYLYLLISMIDFESLIKAVCHT